MTDEIEREEVAQLTEEEERRWNEEQEEERRWNEEEYEERRRDQVHSEHVEGKVAQVRNYKNKVETDNVIKNLAQGSTGSQESSLSDSLVNESQEELTRDLFPQDIKNMISRLKTIVDHIDSPRKQAQDLIHELARLFDERGLCERYNISRKIKEILKDKVDAGKVTGRWIESCLPPEYKRTYVKSELSSLSPSKRKRPDSASMEPTPIQVHESGHSIQQPSESDDTNPDNYTVQSGFDYNSEEGTTKPEAKEEPTIASPIKQNADLTEKKVLVSIIAISFEALRKDMATVFQITKGVGKVFFKVSFDLARDTAEIEFCGITQQRGIDMASNGIGRILKEG
jgi:hypothetical protein